jgi:serine protease
MQAIPFTRRSITVKRLRIIGGSLVILATLTAVVALALTMFAPAVRAEAGGGGTEVFHGQAHPIRGASGQAVTNSLIYYHGGRVSHAPKVYISWWGPQWASGFSTGGYTSAQAQTYSLDFFNGVGSSSWHNIDKQYCDGVAVNTTNCGASGNHISNATFGGAWNDTTSLPRRVSQSSIASAAVRLMNHFGGYNPDAIYLVYTPSGHSMSGFGTQWCAWHSNVNSGGNPIAYGYIPYMPDAGTSCGRNFVNATNNSYGNGYFDGFSIVAGHEFVEAETDPNPSTNSTVGWTGPGGGSDENADKCAWNQNGGVSTNITLGSHSYAVQPNWSNNSTSGTGSHCVTSHT